MFRQLVTLAGVAATLAATLPARPAQAQRVPPGTIAVTRGQLEVTPYAGYIFTSHFKNGPLGTSLGTGNGAIYGAQVALPLAPAASLVGGIGYSSADLQAQIPFLGGTKVGTSVAWLFEGDLQLRASQQNAGYLQGMTPFAQIGAGAIHRQLTAAGMQATSTDFAMNGGVGIDYVISPGLALRVMAKDYVGKASFGNSSLATSNTLNNVALDAGVRFSF